MSKFKVGQKVRIVNVDPRFGDDKNPEYTQRIGEVHVVKEITPGQLYPVEVAAGLIFWEEELEAAE